MQIQVPFNFTPRDYQLDFLDAMDNGGIKRALLVWHRRAGKDKVCFNYMVKEMFRRKGIYYYFLPSYQQGRKTVWETDDKEGYKLLDHIPKEAIARMNNQQMLVELTNGSLLRIIGTDNIDTIVGTNPKGCVFSEFSLQDPRAWDYIQPILIENEGWAIFNGTPRGKNHMYDLHQAVQDNPKWYVSEMQTLWPDRAHYTGIMPLEEIEELRKQGAEDYLIEQEYGVSYTANMQGSIYGDHIKKARYEGRIGSYPYDNNYPVYTFWDLGYNDPTAIWFIQYIGSQIRVIDYFEEAKLEIPELVEALRRKPYKYDTHYLPHDADSKYGLLVTKRQLMEQVFKSHGMDCAVSVVEKLSVKEGINAVQARFSQYCFNSGLCGKAIDMLSRYHRRYDDKRRVFMDEPVHDWTSHCADALRMEAIAAEMDNTTNKYLVNRVTIIRDYDVLN